MDDFEERAVRRARGLGRPHEEDNRIPPEKRGKIVCPACKGEHGFYVRPDPTKLAVFQKCDTCNGDGEVMMMVPVKVRRIMDLQRWDAMLPRERIDTIATQKSVTVLWNEPISVETVTKEHGRAVLTFSATLPTGKKTTIFEVIDVEELQGASPAS